MSPLILKANQILLERLYPSYADPGICNKSLIILTIFWACRPQRWGEGSLMVLLAQEPPGSALLTTLLTVFQSHAAGPKALYGAPVDSSEDGQGEVGSLSSSPYTARALLTPHTVSTGQVGSSVMGTFRNYVLLTTCTAAVLMRRRAWGGWLDANLLVFCPHSGSGCRGGEGVKQMVSSLECAGSKVGGSREVSSFTSFSKYFVIKGVSGRAVIMV